MPRLSKFGIRIIESMKTTDDYTAGFGKSYGHDVYLNKKGVDATELKWCQKNCIGKFGWHFVNDLAVLSFQNERDAFIFKLANLLHNNAVIE